MEKIKVTVKTKDALAITLLDPLQGNLKVLSPNNYTKLKNEIIKDGFSFVVHVYEDNDSAKIYIIDGHQRVETLRRMKEEGYQIPAVPVVFIEADNLDHAKRKVLAAASQYGQYNQNGAEEFIRSIEGISLEDLTENLSMPSIDFNIMDLTPQSDEDKETVTFEVNKTKNTGKEIDSEDFQKFDHKCPKCSFEFNQ